jgi:RNA polymerase primary sigma factor
MGNFVNLNNINANFFERTPAVAQYCATIRKYDVLTQEQERALFTIIDQGCVRNDKGRAIQWNDEAYKARQTIANANQRFVLSVARRFGSSEQILDCISVGNEGMMEAIDKFSLDKNTKFSTYAISYIRRNITQYMRDEQPTVRQTNTSKTFHIISRAKNAFIQREEREPTPEELKDILNDEYGCDIKDVNDVIDMRVMSIDDGVGNDEDDSSLEETSMFNSVAYSDNDYENTIDNDYAKSVASNLCSVLTERENKIISMLFGINGYRREYEPKEVGKELGLTPERVRQIKTSVLEKLKNASVSLIQNI